MISFIVPAFNEEAGIARTLQAIQVAARAAGWPYEVIVADDASADATAEIARENQARVVTVHCRQIAGTRNAGARAAGGELLFFVDADTIINTRALLAALATMDSGAVGGGSLARFEGKVPPYARLLLLVLGVYMRVGGISSGAFMFCTRRAFDAVGGFDERLFGGEDAAMSAALRGQGRFVVLGQRVDTSGRRVRAISGLPLLWSLLRMAFNPSGMLAKRAAVQKIWYNPDRTEKRVCAHPLLNWASNTMALAIVSAFAALPLWIVPWPVALEAGPLGHVKLFATAIINHVGLVLWPCSWHLLRSFSKTPHWRERLKLAVVIGLSLWLAWRSTAGVIGFWVGLLHRFGA